MEQTIGNNKPLNTDSILTKAETRVAEGYVCGLIGKEIADACKISHNTVVTHTQNIYEKTGIKHSTHALVAWFLAKNFDLDLKDITRGFGAFLLFLLVCFQIATTDFGSQFLKRIIGRKAVACKILKRPKRKSEETYHLFDD